MQPYQKASEQIKKQQEIPDYLKNAGKLGLEAASLYGGSKLFSKALPFLSEFIPEDLAVKGLKKISPKIGKFMDMAKESNVGFDEIRNFLKERASKSADSKNIIEQYSPELHQFLKQEIGQGRAPIEAAALATLPAKGRDFGKAIKKLESDHKTSFDKIVQSVFGGSQQAPEQNQSQQSQEPIQPQENIDQALMASLEKILKM